MGYLVGEKEVEVVGCRGRVCADLTWNLGMSFLQVMKLVQKSRLGRKAVLGTTLDLWDAELVEGVQTHKITT